LSGHEGRDPEARHATLTSRDVEPADDSIVFELYSSVRAEELHLDGLEPALRDRILRAQFEAQRSGYREQFPAAGERLILRDGVPIGWVVVDRSGIALRCIDIGFRAEERSKGMGTQVIRALQQEAAADRRPMVLTVQRSNVRARALYTLLGFQATKETELHIVMEWRHE
jgi:ribosomal protein S18 acetylase RimI-like enzyme